MARKTLDNTLAFFLISLTNKLPFLRTMPYICTNFNLTKIKRTSPFLADEHKLE